MASKYKGMKNNMSEIFASEIIYNNKVERLLTRIGFRIGSSGGVLELIVG